LRPLNTPIITALNTALGQCDLPLQVDTKRLDESEEAWLYVEIDPHIKHSIYKEFVGRPIVLNLGEL